MRSPRTPLPAAFPAAVAALAIGTWALWPHESGAGSPRRQAAIVRYPGRTGVAAAEPTEGTSATAAAVAWAEAEMRRPAMSRVVVSGDGSFCRSPRRCSVFLLVRALSHGTAVVAGFEVRVTRVAGAWVTTDSGSD